VVATPAEMGRLGRASSEEQEIERFRLLFADVAVADRLRKISREGSYLAPTLKLPILRPGTCKCNHTLE
jgi:hypothetical protein